MLAGVACASRAQLPLGDGVGDSGIERKAAAWQHVAIRLRQRRKMTSTSS